MEASSSRAPWTAAQAEILLAAVRRALLEAPKVNWDQVFESVQHALPGRTKTALQKRWHAWASSPGLLAQLPEDAAGGLVKAPWTQREAAVLRSAVEDAQRSPGHTIDWVFLMQHTPALAGRTPGALGRYWHSHLSTTPAALAMLREVEEVLAGGGRAAPAAAAAAPLTPFHMLHSLRSAGCIDEQALRVCWLAAAQAAQR